MLHVDIKPFSLKCEIISFLKATKTLDQVMPQNNPPATVPKGPDGKPPKGPDGKVVTPVGPDGKPEGQKDPEGNPTPPDNGM